jgi:aminoglycoside 6'-N-acetyltransferase
MTRWSLADVDFRPLTAGDLPLLYEWLGREHVRRWWGEPGSYDEAIGEYLAAIEGRDPTDLYAIVVAGESVGLIQTYLLADYPEYAVLIDAGDETAGLDIFLAEASLTGSGLGTHVIRTFVSEVVFARAETRACLADPDVRNLGSIRAFEKAGFSAVATFVDPEDHQLHAVMRLERPID